MNLFSFFYYANKIKKTNKSIKLNIIFFFFIKQNYLYSSYLPFRPKNSTRKTKREYFISLFKGFCKDFSFNLSIFEFETTEKQKNQEIENHNIEKREITSDF